MTAGIRDHIERLRSLVPLNALSPEGFQRVVEQMHAAKAEKNETLFRQGDDDDQTLFLLAGRIDLDSGDRVETVSAHSDKSKYALSNLKPRRYTARAKAGAVIARIHSATLEKIQAWDQVAHPPAGDDYEVMDIGDEAQDTEWMIRALRTPAFLRLPAANIQAVLSRFEEIPVRNGQVIIREGDPGDYFYMIKQGSCQVSRKNESTGEDRVCDRMGDGDAFGEDALVTSRPRNATITMTSDGLLMRLDGEDFNTLMKEPLIQWVSARDAALLGRRGAVFLDVRTPVEFAGGSIRNSENLPFPGLRLHSGKLEPDKTYITFCNTGTRSAAAAFLLTGRGLDARALKGGLAALLNSER